MFDENELELLCCGLPQISVDDLRANTEWEAETSQANWFWTVVTELEQSERARLLQFVTGSSHVPLGGFKDFQPKIKCRKLEGQRDRLPHAHTCFNQLDLPAYSSLEDMRRLVRIAITEGNEGFGLA